MDLSHQQVISYDPGWPKLYEAEVEKLRPLFGESLVGVEHIGSTSVPGLSAKPIIDIAVLIKSYKDVDQFIEPLDKLGYKFDKVLHERIEFPERHFFRKGNPTQFHLSVAYADKAKFWPRQLLFRDWLRNNPEDRKAYDDLKKKLIKQDPSGSDEYINGKTELINQILKKAGF